MKKFLKIIFLTSAILVIALIIALIILSRVQHETVRKKVADYLDHEFNGQVTFQDFSLSYLRSFPRVHIELTGISVKEDSTEIIHIGDLDVMLNVRNLLKKSILIEKLVISRAMLLNVVDSLGNRARLFATRQKTNDSIQSSFFIELRRLEIHESKLIFRNEIKNNRSSFAIFSSSLKIHTSDSLITVSGMIDGHLDSLISNGSALFANQPAFVKGLKLNINRATGQKEIVEGKIIAHAVELEPRLTLRPHEDGNLIDLRVSGENNFDEVLGLFEFQLGIDLAQVNPDARLSMTYHQEGFVNPYKRPYSELTFEVNNAVFKGESLPFPVELHIARGNYNNGQAHSPETVELDIDTLFAAVDESFIHGHFRLSNLDDPYIDAHIESMLNLEHIFKPGKNFKLTGLIDLQLDINGKINELRKLHLEGKQQAKAELHVKDLALVFKDRDYAVELVNGSSFLNNHILEIKNLVGEFNKSAFHFKGHFENLDQFIMSDNKDLTGRFNIEFDELDLTKLKLEAEGNKKDGSGSFLSFPNVALEIGIKGKKIITGFGNLEKFAAQCRFEDDHLNVSSLAFNYQQGKVEGSGDLSFGKTGLRTLEARIDGHFGKLDLNFLKPGDKLDPSEKQPMKFPDHLQIKLNLQADMVSYHDASISDFRTGLFMNENKIEISNFHCVLPFGSLNANASIDGYREESISYTGRAFLDIDSIDVESLLALEALSVIFTPSKASPGEPKSVKSLPENINFTSEVRARRILYRGIKISDLDFAVEYTDEKIDLKKLKFGVAGGKAEMDGKLQRLNKKGSPGYLYLKTENIDLGELLSSFDDFGQASFTAENTSGKISTASHHYFELNSDLTFKEASNFWIGNINIHRAEFDNVEPIENTLSFVGHKARDTMYVSELNLNILLAKDKLYVRDLVMNDNIANLALSGEVDVSERELDLFIEVSLTDLLFKSKKKRVAETHDGVFTLEEDARVFLNLSGALTKPKPKVINIKKFNRGREDLFGLISDTQKKYRENMAASE